MHLRRQAEKDTITGDDILSARDILTCPVCGRPLAENENKFICKKGHSFDKARQGYLNLLLVQDKHSISPGDAKEMLISRRAFLDRGFYRPVCDDIAGLLKENCRSEHPVLIDIGSGEGYYTSILKKELNAQCIGVDISKEGAKMSCSRDRDITWIVATASHIPVASGSADAATAVFSLFVNDEYERILKKGGILIEVTAGSRHLIELKRMIYDQVFDQNKKPAPHGDGFETLCEYDRSFGISLDEKALRELLEMTPHFHRIKYGKEKELEGRNKTDLTVNYIIRVLRKR